MHFPQTRIKLRKLIEIWKTRSININDLVSIIEHTNFIDNHLKSSKPYY